MTDRIDDGAQDNRTMGCGIAFRCVDQDATGALAEPASTGTVVSRMESVEVASFTECSE